MSTVVMYIIPQMSTDNWIERYQANERRKSWDQCRFCGEHKSPHGMFSHELWCSGRNGAKTVAGRPCERCGGSNLSLAPFCGKCSWRDPVFLLLDHLIASGYGSTPQEKIDPFVMKAAMQHVARHQRSV